jgi:Na+/glutamate symporter
MATFLIGAAIAAALAIATLTGLVLGMTIGGILIKWLKGRRK